jgi:hypothetical protein
MPRPNLSAIDPDFAELLLQCLAGLMPAVPALSQWLDRYEVRK